MSFADLIFTGGPIIAVDPEFPDPEALALRDGRITVVGTLAEAMATGGPDTTLVRLDGRCLMPGLIEPHTHPSQDMLLFVSPPFVDIRPVTLPDADAVRAVIDRALATDSTEPVVFSGLDVLLQRGFPEPTRRQLDELGPRRPIVIVQNSVHLAWFNEAALRYAGLSDDAEDPLGGHFERDEHGKITKAYETAIGLVVNPIITAYLKGPEALAQEHRYLASRGVTTCADLGFSNDLRTLTQSLYDNGDARVRTRLYEMSDASLAATVGVDNGDDLLKQIGIKIWVDGSPWVGNIYTSFGYLDTWATRALGLEPGHQGKPNYTEGQLDEIAAAYFPEGWQLACHVHGDLAVDMALNVYEHVLRSHPRENHRLRLEHCGAMTAGQFRRAAELGVTCSLFIGHIYYWGDVLTDGLFGPEHGAHWMRARSAFESGMPVSFHNDCPVTPEEPLRNIQIAVTRRSRTGTVHGDSERVDVDQAIRAQTIHAAHQLFVEDIVGSLTPGKYADLVVLSADPRVTGDELPTVLSTYLAGRQTYSAG